VTDEAVRRSERQRALIRRLVGRKVSVSTKDFHHVVGQLLDLDGDDKLRLKVNQREVAVRREAVARIHAVDPALAEYLK
jgi:hypothetical protein